MKISTDSAIFTLAGEAKMMTYGIGKLLDLLLSLNPFLCVFHLIIFQVI